MPAFFPRLSRLSFVALLYFFITWGDSQAFKSNTIKVCISFGTKELILFTCNTVMINPPNRLYIHIYS